MAKFTGIFVQYFAKLIKLFFETTHFFADILIRDNYDA